MSHSKCRDCVNLYNNKSPQPYPAQPEGWVCTLEPKWVKVNRNKHYCSRFVMKDPDSPYPPND